jgi:choline kinase
MNIVMPMAGKGVRLQNFDSSPKPLVKVLGKTIVEWSIETLGINGNYIFCCKKEHIEKFEIDKLLKKVVPNCKIVSIDYQTKGTAQSVLEAMELIDNDEELIISDTDHYLKWDNDFFNNEIRKKDIDGCVMVFPEEYTSKKASYVKLDNQGYVIESAEKQPISKIATVGVHYFKKGSDFVKYAKQMIDNGINFNNEYYVTPIYNLFIKSNKKIITYPVKKMWALGSPDEVDLFLKEYNCNSKTNPI